jgi:hypothetical protein
MNDTAHVYRYGITGTEWPEFLSAMHSGEHVEMDREMWDYWLDVLPPVYMGRRVTLPSGHEIHAAFGFAEGASLVVAFWFFSGRYWCCRTNEMNPVDADLAGHAGRRTARVVLLPVREATSRKATS